MTQFGESPRRSTDRDVRRFEPERDTVMRQGGEGRGGGECLPPKHVLAPPGGQSVTFRCLTRCEEVRR
jgi:hypothetical protein